MPDVTLLFDLDPVVGLDRKGAEGRLNRFDAESIEFHRRVRACYLELAAAEPERFVVLDAARPAEALEVEVWRAVGARSPAAR